MTIVTIAKYPIMGVPLWLVGLICALVVVIMLVGTLVAERDRDNEARAAKFIHLELIA